MSRRENLKSYGYYIVFKEQVMNMMRQIGIRLKTRNTIDGVQLGKFEITSWENARKQNSKNDLQTNPLIRTVATQEKQWRHKTRTSYDLIVIHNYETSEHFVGSSRKTERGEKPTGNVQPTTHFVVNQVEDSHKLSPQFT